MTPPSAATPTESPTVSGLLRPVALEGAAETPGCAQGAPLYYSMMPRRIAWHLAADAPPPGPPGSEPEPEPAMYQPVYRCAVDHFDPKHPFSGARKAVWHL